MGALTQIKPFDQHYGQREFHVFDVDSAMALFGEPVG